MGISIEMLVCEDMTSCTDLSHCHVVHRITRVAKAPIYLTPTTGSDPVFFIIFQFLQ